MSEEIDAKIQEMVRRIVEAVHPDKIILFGSHARGDAGPDSDVDLLIIAPSEEPAYRRPLPAYRAVEGMGVAKDLIWRTPEEIEYWRDTRSHLISRALREGRVLYEKAA
jgi:predicted nucleotidyltransferase